MASTSRTRIAAGLSVCVLSLVFPGWARPAERDIYDLSLQELREIIVTETKIAQPHGAVTQKVEVLPAESLSRQTTYNRNLTELLQYEPGLFVNVLSRNDANWGSYGGLGPKYNSYLLDGLPIDSFIDTMSLDPWALARIEAHRGPAAVMYSNYLSMDFAGNEAPLAGITNCILKDRIETPLTRIQAGAGSFDTFGGRFYHQNHQGGFHYFLGATYEQSDYTDYGTTGSWLAIQDDPDYEKAKLYAKLSYLFGRDDHKLSLFAHHTAHTGDIGRPNREFDHKYDTINAEYANQLTDALHVSVKTGYRNYDRTWTEDNFPVSLTLRENDGVEQHIYPSDLTFNFRHAGESLLTLGADSQVADYLTFAETAGSAATGNDVSSWTTGLFVQEKVVLGKWVLRAGGRLSTINHSYDLLGGRRPDQTEASWQKTLWSAGLRYNALPELSFYANSGSSFVAPSAKSVGGTISAADLGVAGKDGQLPNPGLSPERGIGSDLGVDWRPIEKLAVNLRGFVNRIDNAIVENVVSTTPSQSRSVNAGQTSSSGFEVAVEHTFSESLGWFANATVVSSSVEDASNPDQDGADIPFVPDTVFNAGLSLKLPWDVTIFPFLHRVERYYDSTSKSSRQEFGPYTVVNCRLQKNLMQSGGYAIELAIDLNNITNERYEMPWQFRDPGFNAFGSLEVRF